MSKHVAAASSYYLVFAALMCLTALTVGVAFQDLGRLNDVVALSIAVVKSTLVVLYFMHLRHSARLTWLVLGAGFFWLAVLIVFTMSDMATRGLLGFPGK